MTFGEKVRALRIQNGYSQEELAAMTGVTKRTVRNWENGGKYPRSQSLYEKLAGALSCSEEYLRGERDVRGRRPVPGRYRYDWEAFYGNVLGSQGEREEVYACEIQK